MIFAALFAVVFLHRPLNRWHYSGVALCMVRGQQYPLAALLSQ
jgi:hypothetical protein